MGRIRGGALPVADQPEGFHPDRLPSRLGIPEVACLAGAVGLLIWSANVEAAGSSLSSNSAARVFVELTKPVVLVPRQHGSVRLIFLGPMREAVVIFDRAHEVEPSVGERVELVGELT